VQHRSWEPNAYTNFYDHIRHFPKAYKAISQRRVPSPPVMASTMPHRWAPMSAVVCFHSNRPLVALRISRLRPKAKPCSVWCFGMPCQIFYALDPDGPQPYNDRWDMGRLWVRMQSKQKWHMPSSISKPCCRDCSMLAPPRVAYCCRPVRQLQIACHALPMHSSSCGAIFGSLQCRPSTCVLKRPAVFRKRCHCCQW
jgi:hypothetical protein